MNSAELKLGMFRKIDLLDNSDLDKIHHNFISILDTALSDKTVLILS